MELTDVKESEIKNIYKSMTENFCRDEIRDFDDFEREFKIREYRLVHIVEDGKKEGFMGIWLLDGFAFIEHFVVYEELRNCGIGSRALAECKRLYSSLILEAEPPETDEQIHRIGFYKRNGFFVNDKIEYLQPSYRVGGNKVRLYLLTYPSAIENANNIIKNIYQKVYRVEVL